MTPQQIFHPERWKRFAAPNACAHSTVSNPATGIARKAPGFALNIASRAGREP